jgi:hypothetical protein
LFPRAGDRKERKKKKKKKRQDKGKERTKHKDKERPKDKDTDKEKERTEDKDMDQVKDQTKDKETDKEKERTKDKGRSKDKDGKKKERSSKKKDKSKDKQSKKRKKHDTEGSGGGSEGASKRARAEPHSNGLVQEAVENGNAGNAGQALEGLEPALERDANAAAGSDFEGVGDMIYEGGGEEAAPEAGQELEETDADFERDLLDSLEEANGFPEGAEGDPSEGENGLDEAGGAGDEGNGLGGDGGPGETGGMFSFTGEVAGLDGADLNDSAFDFGLEGNLEAEEDERGDKVTMPWDV